jgi:predicted RND superfamily exporter protein
LDYSVSLSPNQAFMWKAVGEGVLRYRIFFLVLLVAATIFMGWQASQVKLSYEFSKAIPTDNPKYIAYQNFKKQFGEDGNLLVIGVQTDQFFRQAFFNDYRKLQQDIKACKQRGGYFKYSNCSDVGSQ